MWSWCLFDGPVPVDCGISFTLTGAEWACLWRNIMYVSASQAKITGAMSILSRWRAKLKTRKDLLRAAVKRHDAAGHDDAAGRHLISVRRAQVDFAERVLRRHSNEPLRVKALNHARAALARHVFETGGNNRGPEVERIIRYAGGMVGEPWCCDFVIWCYGHAGSRVVCKGFPRAVRMMHVAGTTITSDPKAGDIVRYTFDHTGIFVKDNGNGTITTIEGNTGASGAVSDGNGSDGVYEKIRAKSLVADYLRVSA